MFWVEQRSHARGMANGHGLIPTNIVVHKDKIGDHQADSIYFGQNMDHHQKSKYYSINKLSIPFEYVPWSNPM